MISSISTITPCIRTFSMFRYILTMKHFLPRLFHSCGCFILTSFGVVSVNWQKIKGREKHEKSTKETNQRFPSFLFSLRSRLNITLRITPFSTFYKANGSFKHIEKDKQVRAVFRGSKRRKKEDLEFIVI